MKRFVKIIITFSLLITALLGVACKDAEPTQRVEHNFSVNTTSIVLEVGETFQLVAVYGEETVVFESKDNSVATVSKTGEICAISAGETYIVAKAADAEIACFISVEEADYEFVLSKPSSIVVVKNTIIEITATLYCNQSVEQADITWSVTSSNQCAFTYKGSTALFSSENVGEYTVTAACDYGTKSVVIMVIEV